MNPQAREIKKSWRPAWMDDEQALREAAIEKWEQLLAEWEYEDTRREEGES